MSRVPDPRAIGTPPGELLAVLTRFAHDLAGQALTRPALFARLADMARTLLGAEGAAVLELVDDAHFEVSAPSGSMHPYAGERFALAMARPLFRDAIAQRRGGFANTIDGDTPNPLGVRQIAAAPILLDDRVLGLLVAANPEHGHYDRSSLSLLEYLAAQGAVVMRTERLLQQTGQAVIDAQRHAERLTVLARGQQQLSQLSSEDNLPDGIADAVHQVLPGRVCEILLSGHAEGGDLRRLVRLEAGQRVGSDRAPVADLTVARATALSGVSRLACPLAPGPDMERGVTELCAAVRFGLRTAGVIRIVSHPDRPFDTQDRDLLTIIARHAGTALETARLFALQDLQRRRAEGAAELARVTLQARSVEAGAADLLATLDQFVPSIGKALGVARGRDGVVEYVAANGTLDGLRGQRPAGTLGGQPLADPPVPAVLPSLREAAPPELAATVPDEWAFLVPLAARDRVLGVLLVTAPRQSPLPRRDQVTLERLSSSLALALDALLLDEEERLAREREHLLATALTTINHPIFILDPLGVRYANPAAAREYGYTQHQLMAMRFEQLVVGQDARESRDTAQGVVEGVVRISHDVHRRHDGSEFPAAVSVSPLLGHDGDVLGQVVSVRNVSHDHRLEEQLRHTEKMVALGELVAGVAHEINNPLTGISAFAQLLLEEPLTADQREGVSLIKQESDRAKGVIGDLLLFARKTERGAGPVAVNAMIEQTVRLRAYSLRHAGVQLQLALDSGNPHVRGDLQKLQQVLLNIISNAEHALQGRPTRVLTLSTTQTGTMVHVTATDTGAGMSADVRRRIFEPFFTTKPAGSGTGLGLSVAYGIIEAHGGSIAVESEPDVGTTVRLSLPVLTVP